MEQGSILKSMENRNILVTGATGFLAKVLVEKILRIQPNVKKLSSCSGRGHGISQPTLAKRGQIIGKDLFKVLKQKMGGDFGRFIEEKVRMVAGDVSLPGLGIQATNLKHEMFQHLDFIINSAATIDFHERYDVSLNLNTFGAMTVLNFAKKCTKLKCLVHVSTAYISGEREGLILETSYHIGETADRLVIEKEKRVVEKKMAELQQQRANPHLVKAAMKDLGLERSKMYGWPNVYVFTKALGEMLIMEQREQLSIAIIRPTIVTSSYKEPFPGWIEGIKTIDSLALGYAKGRLPFMACDLDTVLDLIPVDMVVNATLVAMVAQTKQVGETTIYPIGSSLRNPVTIRTFYKGIRYFFKKNPWINKKDLQPVLVDGSIILNSMDSFNKYMTINYILPLKGLELLNMAFCEYFGKLCIDLKLKLKTVLRMVDVYKTYMFFNGVFDDMNVEKLRVTAEEDDEFESDIFYFDPKCIDWEDYLINIQLPGLVQYAAK